MNDPAASGRGILQGVLFKSRDKPRGIKPTGGNKVGAAILLSESATG
ncbi:hypothetical protein MNBD_GAMMA24-919, partial [hydrothermal vent metagenome]